MTLKEFQVLAENLRPHTKRAMKIEVAPLDTGLRGGYGRSVHGTAAGENTQQTHRARETPSEGLHGAFYG